MERFRGNGRKFMRLHTGRRCWQQDITRREHSLIVMKAAGMTVMTAWLYYRSLWMTLPLFPVFAGQVYLMELEGADKKEMEFLLQFKEAIQAVSSALRTGYSMENAFKEAQRELVRIYPEDARISKEMLVIVRQLQVHLPMEKILEEFGARAQTEDVRNFVTVFASAKKSGGNMIAVIQDTARQIGDKIEVKREINTILAAKRYEFRVMTVIPYAIIAYMSISFPEFMGCLYGNAVGVGVMTLCLGIYMGAYYLGVRMIKIEV